MWKKQLDKDQTRAKELFQQMTKKEKVQYIARYYGLHIFVVAALLVSAVTFAREHQQNKLREDWLYLVAPGDYCYEIQAAADVLAQRSGWPEGLNYPVFADDELEGGIGNVQLVAFLTNDEVDFLVCDKATLLLLEEDGTLVFDAVELEQTALGGMVDFRRELFLLTFYDTARYHKVMQFRPVLVPDTQEGQTA